VTEQGGASEPLNLARNSSVLAAQGTRSLKIVTHNWTHARDILANIVHDPVILRVKVIFFMLTRLMIVNFNFTRHLSLLVPLILLVAPGQGKADSPVLKRIVCPPHYLVRIQSGPFRSGILDCDKLDKFFRLLEQNRYDEAGELLEFPVSPNGSPLLKTYRRDPELECFETITEPIEVL
jgi:hypothetical protein